MEPKTSFFRLMAVLVLFVFSFEQICFGLDSSILARLLSDYSSYAIGGSNPTLPLTTFHQYVYDPQGYLKESQEYLERLDGSRQRKNLTRYDSDGNEIYEENEQGSFTYTLFKDRQGRVIRRTGNGEEWMAVDIAEPLVVSPQLKADS